MMVPDTCLVDGKFTPALNRNCVGCSAFVAFSDFVVRLLPQSAIPVLLRTITQLEMAQPLRPPGFCGYVWESLVLEHLHDQNRHADPT